MDLELKPIVRSLAGAGVLTLTLAGPGALAAAPCGPCGAKPRPSRTSGNPCAARNPCAAKNPCAAGDKVSPKLVTRPKGTKPYQGNRAELVKSGAALWNDTKLSTNGLACNTCHVNNAAFSPSFAKPYPHAVAMAGEKSGLKQITAEQMVQFCMIVPMAAKPLKWESKELAALTAYTLEVQKKFKPNPCAAKNPCGAKANPCATRNPCAPKR